MGHFAEPSPRLPTKSPQSTAQSWVAPHLSSSSCTFVKECFGEELRDPYARASVFVNPSTTENFCTTNLEALACATPVVSAAAGGNTEQVLDGVNGALSRPHEPSDMARKVVQILRSSSLRERMASAARASALRYHTLRCGKRLGMAVRQLLAERRAPGEAHGPRPVAPTVWLLV